MIAEGSAATPATKKLCGSAKPVPSFVPKGKKYQPVSNEGEDYETGDQQNGWRCIRFAHSQPHYYQYHYTRDGSPVAPSNPRACKTDCFEAGAIGDLNGDGKYSRFALTGSVEKKKDRVKLAARMFIEQEKE